MGGLTTRLWSILCVTLLMAAFTAIPPAAHAEPRVITVATYDLRPLTSPDRRAS